MRRELLVPGRDLVEPVGESFQTDERQRLADLRVVEAVFRGGIGDHGAQRSEREVGSLRDEQHPLARRPLDPAGAERPDAGQAAEQRRLALARRA